MNNLINRREILKILLFIFTYKANSEININKKLTIVFGSCSNQNQNMDHWKMIISYKPDLLILLGDNVYGDFNNEKASELIQGYNKLFKDKYFKYIRKNIPIIPIWDDHDYGKNDGGKDWIYKDIAKKEFLKFFDIPNSDIRHTRSGIYTSKKINIYDKKINIISLDTRYFKDNFKLNYNRSINKKYISDFDENKTILGLEQWEWLYNEFKNNYDLFVLLSSFQVLSTSHGWEKWHNFPSERNRLLKILFDKKLTLILSGDRHYGGIYNLKNIYEVTASSFNQKVFNITEMDDIRIGRLITENNFGLLEICKDKIDISLVSSNNKLKKKYNGISLKF